MKLIDVFNGDADGICSLIQLRNAKTSDAELVTGVKRDIGLLKRISNDSGQQAKITVLDISFEKNAQDVIRLLNNGAHFDYFDHHQTGKIFKHDNLRLNVSLQANICTSLIVDEHLNRKYHAWAIVGAFGDNLNTVANNLGKEAGYSKKEISTLKQLGQLVNYNAYGEDINDLFYHPQSLFSAMRHHQDPFGFIASSSEIMTTLATGYENDFSYASGIQPIVNTDTVAIYELPNKKWARRVSGIFGNELANNEPNKAHAVIRKSDNNYYQVSIRAPITNKQGADLIASQFHTGGGRKAAAGINELPESDLDRLSQTLQDYYKTSFIK